MQVMIETWIQRQRNQTAELEQFLKRSRQQAETARHREEKKVNAQGRLQVEVVNEDSAVPPAAANEGQASRVEQDAVADSEGTPQELGGESTNTRE